MQRPLCAIALCAGLQAAIAAVPAQRPTPPQAAVMQTALAAPGEQPPGTPMSESAAVLPAALHGPAAAKTAPTTPDTEPQRPTTAAMLLAALALMTGIALRRWGTGPQ